MADDDSTASQRSALDELEEACFGHDEDKSCIPLESKAKIFRKEPESSGGWRPEVSSIHLIPRGIVQQRRSSFSQLVQAGGAEISRPESVPALRGKRRYRRLPMPLVQEETKPSKSPVPLPRRKQPVILATTRTPSSIPQAPILEASPEKLGHFHLASTGHIQEGSGNVKFITVPLCVSLPVEVPTEQNPASAIAVDSSELNEEEFQEQFAVRELGNVARTPADDSDSADEAKGGPKEPKILPVKLEQKQLANEDRDERPELEGSHDSSETMNLISTTISKLGVKDVNDTPMREGLTGQPSALEFSQLTQNILHATPSDSCLLRIPASSTESTPAGASDELNQQTKELRRHESDFMASSRETVSPPAVKKSEENLSGSPLDTEDKYVAAKTQELLVYSKTSMLSTDFMEHKEKRTSTLDVVAAGGAEVLMSEPTIDISNRSVGSGFQTVPTGWFSADKQETESSGLACTTCMDANRLEGEQGSVETSPVLANADSAEGSPSEAQVLLAPPRSNPGIAVAESTISFLLNRSPQEEPPTTFTTESAEGFNQHEVVKALMEQSEMPTRSSPSRNNIDHDSKEADLIKSLTELPNPVFGVFVPEPSPGREVYDPNFITDPDMLFEALLNRESDDESDLDFLSHVEDVEKDEEKNYQEGDSDSDVSSSDDSHEDLKAPCEGVPGKVVSFELPSFSEDNGSNGGSKECFEASVDITDSCPADSIESMSHLILKVAKSKDSTVGSSEARLEESKQLFLEPSDFGRYVPESGSIQSLRISDISPGTNDHLEALDLKVVKRESDNTDEEPEEIPALQTENGIKPAEDTMAPLTTEGSQIDLPKASSLPSFTSLPSYSFSQEVGNTVPHVSAHHHLKEIIQALENPLEEDSNEDADSFSSDERMVKRSDESRGLDKEGASSFDEGSSGQLLLSFPTDRNLIVKELNSDSDFGSPPAENMETTTHKLRHFGIGRKKPDSAMSEDQAATTKKTTPLSRRSTTEFIPKMHTPRNPTSARSPRKIMKLHRTNSAISSDAEVAPKNSLQSGRSFDEHEGHKSDFNSGEEDLIGASREQEYAKKAKPFRKISDDRNALVTGRYPRHSSEITINWIHYVLAQYHAMDNVRISSVKIQRRSRDRPLLGINLSCNAVRAVVDFKSTGKRASVQGSRHEQSSVAPDTDIAENGQPKRPPRGKSINLIIKFMPTREKHRQIVVGELKMFQREVEFYSRVVPDLMTYLSNKGENPHLVLSMIPRCYFAAIDARSRWGCIVIEDPGAHNVEPSHLQNGLPTEMAQMVLKELAVLHAVSFGFSEEQGKLAFLSYDYMTHKKASRELLSSSLGYGLKLATDGLSAAGAIEDLSARYLRNFTDDPEYLETYENIQMPDKDLSVLCHGDLWLNNIYFKRRLSREVLLTDFHLTQFTHPACDLVVFLYTSLSSVDRPRKMRYLLQYYYNAFCKHVYFLTSRRIQKSHSFEDFTMRFIDYAQNFGVLRLCISVPLSLVDHSIVADVMDDSDDLETFKANLMAKFQLTNAAVFRIIARLASVFNEICLPREAMYQELTEQ